MAFDDLLDEHEQGERVREWLKRNGFALVAGIALGLGAIYGWKWWQGEREARAMAGGNAYQAAVDAIEANDPKAADKVKALRGNAYAALAALALARAQVEAGQRDAAIATLRGIRSGDPALQDIVDQRLARLLIDAGKADEALQLLAGDETPAALEIRGDAEFARDRREQAREAYARALSRLDVGSPRRTLVELKLTQAGGTPPAQTPAQNEAQS